MNYQKQRVSIQNLIKFSILFTFSIYLIAIIGCAGKRVDTVGFNKTDAPNWVIKGSGAFKDKSDRIFYGVGSASGIKNYSLLRTTSENRARNEVAKVFDIYISSLLRDYATSTTAGNFDLSNEEQHVEQAIKSVVSVTLSGVEIIDHYEIPEKNLLFSLAKLNLDKFGENLESMKELNSTVRDFVRENARKLHEKLIKEEQKINNNM